MISQSYNNMSKASKKRWIAAQRAEAEYGQILEQIELPIESQYFSKKFPLLNADIFNGKNILEVGCSPAAEIHYLEEAHFRVGIDPLALVWRHLYRDGTDIVQGIGEYLPFRGGTFDIVLCLNVLDHVQNSSHILKEIKKVLKDGGRILIHLQTYSTPRIIRKGVLNYIDRPHPFHFTDSEVYYLLRNIGYSVDSHHCMKVGYKAPISVIKSGLIISGFKSLAAKLFLGLCDSFFMCSKNI